MYAPLGALSRFGKGALEGYTDDLPKIYEMMGAQALGRAFQPMAGPIDQMNVPQPPMPGQPSAPAAPPSMEQGPMPGGAPPLGMPPPPPPPPQTAPAATSPVAGADG